VVREHSDDKPVDFVQASGAPEKELALHVQTKSSKQNKFRAMPLSLDGLLDYDENDRFEATFEVRKPC
jgi:hypothetical protein